MLYTVIGIFADTAKPWRETVNSQGILRAANEAKVKCMKSNPDALPPGSYRDDAVKWEFKDQNVYVIAVIPGNHVVRLRGAKPLDKLDN